MPVDRKQHRAEHHAVVLVDAGALDEYDQHGRIRGTPPDTAMHQAVRAYVASYLDGRDVLLMAADWARCRELSARIRDDMIHLGLVDNGRTIRIAEGAEASAMPPDLGSAVSASDCERPLVTGVNGPLMARRS